MRNFDVVTSEFIQILHTGSDHWVCVSSNGCSPGLVNLYDSLYHDVISQEVEEQTCDLLGGNLIEGFRGKRALGILRKIELCQKHSKFRMQFCLGVLNNVLHVFSLKLASFLRYYVCEKHIFPRASSRDLLLNEKQTKNHLFR